MTIFEVIRKRFFKKRISNVTMQDSIKELHLANDHKVAHCLLLVSKVIHVENKDSQEDVKKGYDEYESEKKAGKTAILFDWKYNLRLSFNSDHGETQSILAWDGGLLDDLKETLAYLTSDEAKHHGWDLKKGYDIAWIKLAIDKGLVNASDKLSHYSNPDFLKMIYDLGIPLKQINDKTLLRYYNLADTSAIPWKYKTFNEVKRKRTNRIIQHFVYKMASLRGMNDNVNHFMNQQH